MFFYMLKEAKKKYDKETEKYCALLEKHLSLSAKKKESHLHEVCFLELSKSYAHAEIKQTLYNRSC